VYHRDPIQAFTTAKRKGSYEKTRGQPSLSGDVLRKMMQEKKVNLKELDELIFHTNQGLSAIEQKYSCKLLRVEFAFE
jgi:hypothetical protein